MGGTYTEYDNGGNVTYKYLIWEDQDNACAVEKELYFAYENENWQDLLTSVNGVPITYDAIGNPLSYDGKTYTWSAGRELASITSADMSLAFKYNDSGLRTHKTVTQNGVTTTYTYAWSQDGRLISQSDGTTTLYFVYDENSEIIGFSKLTATANEMYYYVKNLQGDVCAIVDSTGATVVSYTYDAWGYLLETTGSQATTLGVLNPIRYRGYYYDTETSYYYLQSRYYDPLWGRFINADGYCHTGTSLISTNMYLYCDNNSVIGFDPTGYYNRNNAVSYARKWTGYTNKNIRIWNPKYKYYWNGDCANFVSQCLHAGGINMTSSWYSRKKYYSLISLGGMAISYSWDIAKAWRLVDDLINFICNFKYCYGVTIVSFCVGNMNAEERISLLLDSIGEVQLGDLIFMDTHIDGKEDYNHATIITGKSSTDVYYAGHTSNRSKQSLKAVLNKGDGSSYFEHILIVYIRDNAI